MSQNALPITVTIRGFVQSEFSCRTNVQREMSPGPTENNCANLTPLRLCWYFTDDNSRLVARHICGRNVKVARVIAACSYHFVIALWRAKEHNRSRKLLGNHR